MIKSRGLRHPRTTQERRNGCRRSSLDVGDYVIQVRAKRSRWNLPDVYDDIWRSDATTKTWKRFKLKRQWCRK